MNTEQTERINLLEADINKLKNNNNYGFTKIKNIVCNEADLDQVLFIIKCLKIESEKLGIQKELRENKPLEEIIKKYFSKSPLYTNAVEKILKKYNII